LLFKIILPENQDHKYAAISGCSQGIVTNYCEVPDKADTSCIEESLLIFTIAFYKIDLANRVYLQIRR
jgi:hypothetical protein